MNNTDILAFVFKSERTGVRYYVEVIEAFPHHFTGETMRRLRIDYVGLDGRAVSYTDTMNTAQFCKILDLRVEE